MRLKRICLERYKGYQNPIEVELARLTILVGANNSGKTALARAIQMLAGGLTGKNPDPAEPIPLKSGEIIHGTTFEDLVSNRVVHGRLKIALELTGENDKTSLSAEIRNVITPSRPSERQISEWRIRVGHECLSLIRTGFDTHSPYNIAVSGIGHEPKPLVWNGLIPRDAEHLAQWLPNSIHALGNWASSIRHLQCPRQLMASPFDMKEYAPSVFCSRGQNAPLLLASDDELRETVRDWFRKVFAVAIDVKTQGSYLELLARKLDSDVSVSLEQSGGGLSHVLPVVVMALTAPSAGPGVDIVEHPEAELHPAVHADVAEILLESLSSHKRPLVIETHSEMLLLRARRWIAEGRLSATDVLIYWIDSKEGGGSCLRKITIDECGRLNAWPEGVFVESYEEIMAIRRAARAEV